MLLFLVRFHYLSIRVGDALDSVALTSVVVGSVF